MEKQTQPFSQRLFRALVRVLPFDFRTNYQGEMEGVFQEQRREVEEHGGILEAAKLWKETIVGIFTTARALANPDERLCLRRARHAQESRLHTNGGSHARAGHRRKHRHLQRRTRCYLAAASLSRWAAINFHPAARKADWRRGPGILCQGN